MTLLKTILKLIVRSINVLVILYFCFISGRSIAISRFNPNDCTTFTITCIIIGITIILFVKGAIIKPSKSFACERKKIIICEALICTMFSAIGIFDYINQIGAKVGTINAIILSTMIVLGGVCMLHIIPVIMYHVAGMKPVIKFRKAWKSLWMSYAEYEYDDNDDEYDDNNHVGYTPLY